MYEVISLRNDNYINNSNSQKSKITVACLAVPTLAT